MAVPKRRTSRSKKGTRRSHHHVVPVQIQFCVRCSEPVMPHRVCSHCGYYQGRDALPVEAEEKQGK